MVRITKDTPDKLKPFLFYGIDITNHHTEANGDCPFCDKPGHLFVKTATGQWHCKVCDEQGNIPVLLAKLHETALNQTSPKEYTELAKDRKVTPEVLKRWGVAKSFLTEDWLIPAYNDKGKLSNLYKVTQDENGKWVVMSCPGCKLWPMGTQFLNKRTKSVYVSEGPWDGMALETALASVKEKGGRLIKVTPDFANLGTKAVIAAPGCGNFNPDWATFFQDCETHICFDNDHPRKNPKTNKVTKPGWDGSQRAVKLIGESGKLPSALYLLKWGPDGFDPSRADGFDIRDLVATETPGTVLATLKSLFVKIALDKVGQGRAKKSSPKEESEEPELEGIYTETFAKLLEEYSSGEKGLHLTPTLQDTLGVMLGCVFSTTLGGDQVWLRIIGPPGSGKSTLAEAISATKKYIYPVSQVRGFHSGFVGGGRGKGDASLIPLIDGKTVIIKDGDTLMTTPNVDQVLAEMRDIWDGVSRATYRNRVSSSYDGIKSTFMLCGTDGLRRLNRSFLGERFLDCEILGKENKNPYLERSLTNTYNEVVSSFTAIDNDNVDESKMLHIKRVTIGFITHYKEALANRTLSAPDFSPGSRDKIKALGEFVSLMRARIERDGTDMAYRPRIELGTRPVNQFTKLAICLALLLGRKSIDSEVIRILRGVANATMESFQYETVKILATTTAKGVTAKQLEDELRISEGQTRKLLGDMREFDVTTRMAESNRSGVRGRNRHIWKLTPNAKKLYKTAMLS